jgi:hypothetical protein
MAKKGKRRCDTLPVLHPVNGVDMSQRHLTFMGGVRGRNPLELVTEPLDLLLDCLPLSPDPVDEATHQRR